MVTLYHMVTVYLYLSNWGCWGQGSTFANQRSSGRHHACQAGSEKGQLAKLHFGLPDYIAPFCWSEFSWVNFWQM